MKKKIGILLCIATIILSGCTKQSDEKKQVVERESAKIEVQETKEEKKKETEEKKEIEEEKETEKEIQTLEESVYIGEYLDYDNNEPNLEIAKGEDGTYIVQIGIFRLTTLEDGVGELTKEGMVFTATDASGDPISGIITVEDQIATVTFTDSTWGYLENGSTYKYTKSSDVPNVWDAY